jgi:hypothetical protein
MTPPESRAAARAARLAALVRERDELAANLPAHSIPATMLIRLEDLEAEIAALQAVLDDTDDGDSSRADSRSAGS